MENEGRAEGKGEGAVAATVPHALALEAEGVGPYLGTNHGIRFVFLVSVLAMVFILQCSSNLQQLQSVLLLWNLFKALGKVDEVDGVYSAMTHLMEFLAELLD